MDLARNQQKILEDLVTKLFNESIEGLNKIKNEVLDLQQTHRFYRSNIYQLHQLKGNITLIQQEYDARIDKTTKKIRNEKEQTKQILSNALDRLETIVDKNIAKQYLDELLNELDKQIAHIPLVALLGTLFGSVGFTAIIAAILFGVSGSFTFALATFGVGAAGGAIASEALFRTKLSALENKLTETIENVENEESLQLNKLTSYFDSFVHKMSRHSHGNEAVDIAWFDKNIQSSANQSLATRLLGEFAVGEYQLIQFNDQDKVIQFVQKNVERNIILITSGSAGEIVISEIGHYWNIKGIIIFCVLVDEHKKWSKKNKKVLLVTKNTDEVIQKIRSIESGDIYFLINGFSFEDIQLKLKNMDYYLSTKRNGFMIQEFSSINSDMSYHKGIMERLYELIQSKNIYPNGIPHHFKRTNLDDFIKQFLLALKGREPEKAVIALYTQDKPYYYKIINDILNQLDEELIQLASDYIKALRYALIIYADRSNTIPCETNVKFYRGLHLGCNNSLQEFQRKFRTHDTIIFPSFLSTSLDRKEAEFFANEKGILLEISADCTQAHKPKCIATESHYKHEREVLLNCFSMLQVTKITRITEILFSYECILKFC